METEAGMIRDGGSCVDRALAGRLCVVVPREKIAARVSELAGDISAAYATEDLTLVGVLTGAFMFLGDLLRALAIPVHLDVASVCSYPGGATESHRPRLRLPPAGDLAGRHVLLVDDILDSGRTLAFLVRLLSVQEPASLRTCVLLQKYRPDLPARIVVDMVGFDVPDEFIVGYGLDHDDLHRNLPDLCVLDGSGRVEEGKP